MADLTVEEVYRGRKYNIIGKVINEILNSNLDDSQIEPRTEVLIVKYSLLAYDEIKKNSDVIVDLYK